MAVPEAGEILSQEPPLFVEMEADQEMDPPLVAELLIASVCGVGEPPAATWKDRDVGETASVPGGVTIIVTLMVSVLDAAAEVI